MQGEAEVEVEAEPQVELEAGAEGRGSPPCVARNGASSDLPAVIGETQAQAQAQAPFPPFPLHLGGRAFVCAGGGGNTALWLDPPLPQKMAQLTAPTETDPWAPELTRTHDSAKNENGLLESAHQGASEKSSFAMSLVKKKWTIFNAPKKFSAPSVPDFVITD